jgi:hypothetical protein
MSYKCPGLILLALVSVPAQSQNPPSVSQVLLYSTLTNRPVQPSNGFTPTVNGTVPKALLSIYTGGLNGNGDINNPQTYSIANLSAPLTRALGANIAVALSVIPVESPTSGLILRNDPSTGVSLPAASTLGPIFTQRAETIGKGKFYMASLTRVTTSPL